MAALRAALLFSALVSLSFAAAPAWATTFDLADGNASLTVETDFPLGRVHDWRVDDTLHMNQQWFFVRLGDEVLPLEALGLVGEQATDTNTFIDDRLDTLAVRYGGAQFQSPVQVDLTLTLRGGESKSGTSDVAELLRIQNVSAETISISFFQYVDFDLNEDAFDLEVALVNANTVRQTDGNTIAEEVVTPAPDDFEVGLITDVDLEDLSGEAGPVTDGDLVWALEWRLVLDPRESFLISKDKQIRTLPEPAFLGALVLFAAAALARARR
jgi:hypothetical protein